jgi:hypothetical protein
MNRCSILLIVGIALLADSLNGLQRVRFATDLKSLWSYGFGNSKLQVDIFVRATSSQFMLAVSFANSWQLEVSCLYLLYNALLTTLCVAEEWSHFGNERKFLRVSAPKGMQRSTYFLSLPYRYGVPASICMSFLHWCISQSVFLERAVGLWPDGTRNYKADSSRIGVSSIGLIFSVSVGGLFILGLVCLGFRKVTFHLPIVSTNSAAISAATHCPKEDVDACLLPVKWGVVKAPSLGGPGHCCFTTAKDVAEPDIRISYIYI